MPRQTVKAKLEAQEKAIADAKQRAEKIKISEAKRLLKFFDKVGFFEVDVPDEALENSLRELVRNAGGASQEAPAPVVENA